MKRIFSSVLAIVLFIGAANAQDGERIKGKERKEGREMSLKGADLTSEQENRIKAINADYRKQVTELKAQGLSPEQMKTKRQALHTKHTADIKAVLTEEQKSRIANARTERKSRDSELKRDSVRRDAKGRFTKGEPAARKGAMAANLDLSAEQQSKMQSIRSSYKSKLEAVQNDSSLSKEAKREKVKDLMKAQQEEMKSVLSTEQQTKMKGMRRDAAPRRK